MHRAVAGADTEIIRRGNRRRDVMFCSAYRIGNRLTVRKTCSDRRRQRAACAVCVICCVARCDQPFDLTPAQQQIGALRTGQMTALEQHRC